MKDIIYIIRRILSLPFLIIGVTFIKVSEFIEGDTL